MKIHFEHNGTVFEYGRYPMPERRFRALCILMLAVIGGAVLLGLVHMLGVWGIVWPIAALAMVGLYEAIKQAVSR